MVYLPIFKGFLPLKGHLEFSGAFFLAEIFEKVRFAIPIIFGSLDFQLGRTIEKFLGDKKNADICRLNTKIRLTMLCLSGFKLYSRWVPLLRVRRDDRHVLLKMNMAQLLELLRKF